MIDIKPFIDSLNGKPLAVLGMGISNTAVINAAIKAGCVPVVWDDNEKGRNQAQELGAEVRPLTDESLEAYGALVAAPGIPFTFPEPHPVIKKAKDAGIEILCDLEILHRIGHGRTVIGVTGTNGKSTTTALIGHVLESCDIDTVVGGNIGKAALDMDLPDDNGAIVLEVSSFQADLCPTFRPDISVLLNLSPDHLDRHGTMEEYAKAKARLFDGSGKAIIAVDDDWSQRILSNVEKEGARDCFAVSMSKELDKGVFFVDDDLHDKMVDGDDSAFEFTINTLPGVHNRQNAAAAFAASRLMGLSSEEIFKAMKAFPGLPHRQFLVRAINGVTYINDSKATNAAATSWALRSYKNIFWIVGGSPKEGGLNGLEPYLGNVRHAFIIGQAMEDFAKWLDNHDVPHNFSRTLDIAVQEAHDMAQGERGQPGGAGKVLLSPACASFDQFKNFEDRGQRFVALVDTLPEDAA